MSKDSISIKSPSSPSPARTPSTPESRSQPKAKAPNGKIYTYAQCLARDRDAVNKAKADLKMTDAYIEETNWDKRYTMLAAAEQDAITKRIAKGMYTSCLFEQDNSEDRFGPEAAAQKWDEIMQEISLQKSGLRGKRDVIMRAKNPLKSADKVSAIDDIKEDEPSILETANNKQEDYTSKVIIID